MAKGKQQRNQRDTRNRDKNLPPIAVLTVSKNEITLPENAITLDLSQSHDPNKKGEIVKFEFFSDSPDFAINQTDKTANAVFSKQETSAEETHSFRGRVTDRGGLFSEATVQVIVKPQSIITTTTVFGASGATIDSPATLKSICPNKNGKYVSRSAIELRSHNGGGSREADKYLDAGCTMFINLNWERPTTSPGGDKVGAPFPKDMDLYKSKLKLVFDYYKNHPQKENIIFAFENEPTNTDMHQGTMEDYGNMLKTAGPFADEYGFKWCDGAVHVDTVLGANLDDDHEGSGGDAGKLLDIYATLPTMYAVNMHTSNARSNSYDSNRIVQAVKKVKEHTGHNVVSNEWHSQYQNDTACIMAMTKGWADAGVEYAVYISKGGDKNNSLNEGGNLTQFGQAYKNFITNI